MSVKAALERLGFGPRFGGIAPKHGRRALAGGVQAGGVADWPVIFGAIRPPGLADDRFLGATATAYPNAKILLTERDPERWRQSHVEMFRLGAGFGRELTDERRQ